MRRINAIKILSTAAVLSSTALQSAWAWEAEAVADRLKSSLGEQGIETTWSGVRQDGDSVVIEGLKFGMQGAFEPIPFGELVLGDVSEDEQAYHIDNIVIDSFQHADDGVEVVVEEMETRGLVLPKEGAGDPFGGVMRYEQMTVTTVRAGDGGPEPFFAVRNGVANNRFEEDEVTFTGSADEFSVNFLALAASNAKSAAALQKLGYEQLQGRFDMAGRWTPSDGRMTLEKYELQVDEAGTLNMTADFAGYTTEFFRALREVQNKMNAATGEQKQAQGLQMLGLFQQLTLHGASIRFDDASLTGRLLDYVAEQQGGSPEAVANQVKAFVPLMAGQYLGPDLTVGLTKAITAYLDDPQSLEIRVEPEEPLPFALLMGVAMSSPEALAKQAGLQVLANQ